MPFIWTPVLVFFWEPAPDIVYRKIAAAFYWYQVMNLGCCYSILGLAANQKRLKCTFQRCIVCHVLKQYGFAIFRKCEEKFSVTENLGVKL